MNCKKCDSPNKKSPCCGKTLVCKESARLKAIDHYHQNLEKCRKNYWSIIKITEKGS